MQELSSLTRTDNTSQYQLKKRDELKEKEWVARHKNILAIIGHDLKTPMSAMIGFLSLLKDKVHAWDRGRIEENINIALTAAQRTNFLLDNLLQWAIAENSKSFQPEFINLATTDITDFYSFGEKENDS